jgi:4-hydroxy-4-methyl-2-oxoglutarate aldolase
MRGPLTAEQLEALRGFSTPTICNAIELFKLRPRDAGFMDHTIACRFPELGPMVGYAVTAKIRAKEPPDSGEIAYGAVWPSSRRRRSPGSP